MRVSAHPHRASARELAGPSQEADRRGDGADGIVVAIGQGSRHPHHEETHRMPLAPESVAGALTFLPTLLGLTP